MLKLMTILFVSCILLAPVSCSPAHTLLDELEDQIIVSKIKNYLVNRYRDSFRDKHETNLDFLDDNDVTDNDDSFKTVADENDENLYENDKDLSEIDESIGNEVYENDESDILVDDSSNDLYGHASDKKATKPAPPEDVDENLDGKVSGDHNGDELDHGDIMFRPGQRKDVFQSEDESNDFTVSDVSKTKQLWPNGIVPYVIQKDLGSSHVEKIREAVAEYKQKTCIRLVPRKQEKNYIHFKKGQGCWSYVGMSGGEQTLSLGVGCDDKKTVVHEVMHALGFWHEQSRPDRDNYIKILLDNVPEDKRHNFEKKKAKEVDTLGFPYDYHSVMHYNKKAFGKRVNGVKQITIVSLDKKIQKFGQCWSCGLSKTDAEQLNKLYCNSPVLRIKRLTYEIKEKMAENKDQSNDGFRETLLEFLKNRYRNHYWTVSVYNTVIGSNRHAYKGSCVHVWQYENKNVLACFAKKTSHVLKEGQRRRIGKAVARSLQDKGCHAGKSIGFAFKEAASFGYPIAAVQIVRHGSELSSDWFAKTVFLKFRCRKVRKNCNPKKRKCRNKMSDLVIMFK